MIPASSSLRLVLRLVSPFAFQTFQYHLVEILCWQEELTFSS